MPVGRFRMDDVTTASTDPQERLLKGEEIAANAAAAKKTILIGPDEFSKLVSPSVMEHDTPIRSVVAMPLVYNGNVFAVLEFFTGEENLSPAVLPALDQLSTSVGAIYHRHIAVVSASENHAETQILLDLITAMVWYQRHSQSHIAC